MYRLKEIEIRNLGTHEHTVYQFREGKPTIIIGENKDDSGQIGNGSGKSWLIEAVSIAVSGQSIRNVKAKELVQNGCESAEVKLILENGMIGVKLEIWRKLYSNGKAQEIRVFENSVQQVVSDINEYNKLIWTYLDISKEDFFSFYLITKDTYEAFLAVGDSKKKAIINRFSGADKIDEVNPHIEVDIKELQEIVNEFDRQINLNQGKQELISDQIKAEEEKFSEEGKEKLLIQFEEELDNFEDCWASSQSLVEGLQQQLIEANKTKNTFNKVNWDKDISEKEVQLFNTNKLIERKKAELPKQQDKFKGEMDNVKQTIKEIDEQLEGFRRELKEAREIKINLEKQLAGIIECPKCHYEFNLEEEGFVADKVRSDIKDIIETIDAIQSDLIDNERSAETTQETKLKINQKILEAQSTIKKEIERLNEEAIQHGETIKVFKQGKRSQDLTIQAHEDAIQDITRQIIQEAKESVDAEKEINRIKKDIENIKNGKSDKIDELEQQLLKYLDESVELQEKLQVAVDNVKAKEEWYTNFKNFKSYLANQSIKNIQDYTNMYLQMMNSNLSIEIEGYRMLSTKKLKEEITTSVKRNGFDEGSYGKFSGGERARIDVAVMLAVQSLININASSGGLDLLMADEIMDSVDDLGLECIVNGLQNVDRTVLLISQIQINSLKENTLIIRKENKISKIV